MWRVNISRRSLRTRQAAALVSVHAAENYDVGVGEEDPGVSGLFRHAESIGASRRLRPCHVGQRSH